MDIDSNIRAILATTLQLAGGPDSLSSDSLLLGALPEFDSMAVVTVVAALEEHFGIVVDDDELEAQTFESVASLGAFVADKLGA